MGINFESEKKVTLFPGSNGGRQIKASTTEKKLDIGNELLTRYKEKNEADRIASMAEELFGKNPKTTLITSDGDIITPELKNKLQNPALEKAKSEILQLANSSVSPKDALNEDGTLKEGYLIAPDGTVVKQSEGGSNIREIMPDGTTKDPYEGYTDSNGNTVGQPQTLEYRPERDDYQPTFEVKDGKLVQTGKKHKEPRQVNY